MTTRVAGLELTQSDVWVLCADGVRLGLDVENLAGLALGETPTDAEMRADLVQLAAAGSERARELISPRVIHKEPT